MATQRLINFVKEKEGFRAQAYKDPAGVWTIGYGRTEGVKAGQTTTKAAEENWMIKKLDNIQSYIIKASGNYCFNQNELDALTSFCYNLGIGAYAQVTKNNTRSKADIAKAMLLYTKAAGKVLPGLVIRRQQEHDMFLEPCDTPIVDYYPAYVGGSEYLYDMIEQIGASNDCNWRTVAGVKPIAEANGIMGYKGSKDQNIKLKDLMLEGKLRRPSK